MDGVGVAGRQRFCFDFSKLDKEDILASVRMQKNNF